MSSKRRVVITGLGAMCASGIGMDKVWDRCLSGHNAIGAIQRFNTRRYGCKVGGELDGFDAAKYVAPQVLQQTDRSSQMGIAACQLAAEDAGLVLKNEDPNQVGIYFSNLMGGMEFAEPELYAQAFLGAGRVNAYQAIAWFYAAAQGQWSIQTGIRGHAKTVVADRAGGLQSVGLAAHAIRHEHCNVAFAGGFEAPLVPYAFLMYGTTGLLSKDTTDPLRTYRPFHRKRTGMVLGEGSGILVVEELEHAQARKARIYAEITGFSVAMDAPADPAGSGLARCFSEALCAAGLEPKDIDHVNAEGAATQADDYAEAAALQKVFAGTAHSPTVSSPKSMFGHTLAAAGALDAALACKMIQNNVVLPTVNLDEPDPQFGSTHFNDQVLQKQVDAVASCSRGKGGLNTVVILQRHN